MRDHRRARARTHTAGIEYEYHFIEYEYHFIEYEYHFIEYEYEFDR